MAPPALHEPRDYLIMDATQTSPAVWMQGPIFSRSHRRCRSCTPNMRMMLHAGPITALAGLVTQHPVCCSGGAPSYAVLPSTWSQDAGLQRLMLLSAWDHWLPPTSGLRGTPAGFIEADALVSASNMVSATNVGLLGAQVVVLQQLVCGGLQGCPQ